MTMHDSETIGPEPDQRGTRPNRRRRLFRNGAVVVAILALLFYGGLGWVFSSKIQNDAFAVEAPGGPEYEVEVLDQGATSIVLSRESGNDHLDGVGIRGVRWRPDGYGQIGRIISSTETSITREFSVLLGNPPPNGALVDLDGAAYPENPRTALGLDYETITYQSDVGTMEAWSVPGAGDSWVIFVHGKTGPLRDALRVMPALHSRGYNVLAIKYRNDVGVPQDPSGEYGYGQTEWRDLEGAIEYVVGRGARDVSLIGYSMGGAIVTSFMLKSDLAHHVDAVVLDAPMLDFSKTVDLGARNTNLPLLPVPLPQSLTTVAKALAEWRFDIDWNAIDYFDEIDRLGAPILLFHGTDDERVPLATSEQLARQRPGITEFHVFAGAGHNLSWNADPNRYETLLLEFLDKHTG